MAQTFYALLTQWGPVVALLLQALVLSRFLHPRNRDYPLAILYSALLFILTSLVILWQNKASWLVTLFPPDTTNTEILAGVEVFLFLLLLGLTLQLLRQTLAQLGQSRRAVLVCATASLVVFAAAVYWFSLESKTLNYLFNRVRQTMSFWLVLLNLYWWTLLLRLKNVGRRVLLLSAGIGLLMTGQVVSDGLLGMSSRETWWLTILAVVVLFLSNFASLAAWYEAFHLKNAKQEEPSLNGGMALPKTNGESRLT